MSPASSEQVVRDPELVKQLLDSLPIFSELTDRERDILSGVFVVRVVEAGEALCREGEPGASFFIVAKGVVEVFKELPGAAGQEKLAEIGPNNLLGQVSLIDGKPRSATCVARERAIALECGRGDFERLFQAGSPFAFKVTDQVVIDLAKRLREANQQIHDLYAHPKRTLAALQEKALHIQQTITI